MSDSPNFLTYAQTAFDPFEERPFCAVDSLVFAICVCRVIWRS